MAVNKDLENKFIHCDIETNLPDNGSLFIDRAIISVGENGIMPYEEIGKDYLDIQKVNDIVEWNISGHTNDTFDERESSVFIRTSFNGSVYDSPRMTVKQHRKPNDYSFYDLKVRYANDAYGNRVNDLTVSQKGGRVIVSACAIVNGDENRVLARVDDFNLKISNVYSNLISQIGLPHEVKDVNGNRVEWILNVSRNDNFDGRNAIIFCEFTNENSGKKEYKNITIKQEARQHTYTKPVLTVSETSIDYETHRISWEAYYTIDGVKQKVDTFLINGLTPGEVSEEIEINRSSDGFSGQFIIAQNWDSSQPDTSTEIRGFEIKAIVTGSTGAVLGEKLGMDGNKSDIITIWQDNYTPARYEYKFEVTPYYLPSSAYAVGNNGVKAWVNHVSYNESTFYVKVISTMKKQEEISQWESPTENYISGVTVNVIGGGYVKSHGWSQGDEYKITLKAFDDDEGLEENTSRSRMVMLQFIQKDVNGNKIKEVQYKIYQMDKYCQPLFAYNYDAKTEPSHILLTMGSDLLTGNGFGVSGNITNTTIGTTAIGTTSTEFGDSGNMTLYWGGPNTNSSGNQYIAFSPKSYSDSTKKNITLTVYGSTQQIGVSRGVVSVKAETMSSAPIAQKSGKHGVNNVLLPSGTVYKKTLCHSRISGDSKTELFMVRRYYQDGSIFLIQSLNATPKYSLDTQRQGKTLQNNISAKVACEQGATLSMVENEIKAALFRSNQECCSLLQKNSDVLSTEGNFSSFKNVELYYDSTEYRLCAIAVMPNGGTSYSHYYNSDNFGDLNLLDYAFNNDSCVFIFEPSNELTESEAQYIERKVVIFNTSGSNNYPSIGYKGMIYDPVTKKSTEYTISDLSSSSVSNERVIRWKDVSNGSKDGSRKLKLISIDGISNGKITEGGFTWIFKGFRNSSDNDSSLTHTYVSIDNFQYAFNSSTPYLELGFEDGVANTIHVNVRFTSVNSINGRFITESYQNHWEYQTFSNVDVLYDFYRWNHTTKPTASELRHFFVDLEDYGRSVSTDMTKLFDPVGKYGSTVTDYRQGFQIMNATEYTSASSAPAYDLYFQENEIGMPDDTYIVVSFTICDTSNYNSPGKKRAMVIGVTTLERLKSQPYMHVYCGPVYSGELLRAETDYNNAWIYYREDFGTAISTATSLSKL